MPSIPRFPDPGDIEGMRVPPAVMEVIESLRQGGFKALLVGGALRDFLLRREIMDWDVLTDCPLGAVMRMFPRVIPTGARHYTVLVLIGAMEVEVSTIRGTDIIDDLRHRDFTINSMAYDPVEGRFLDPFNGYEDLMMGLIRCVEDPVVRLEEDPLRILRAIRFVSETGFTLESSTKEAIFKKAPQLRRVAVERIKEELHRIVLSARPTLGLTLLKESGVVRVLLGQCEERAFKGELLGRVLEALPADGTVRWTALCLALCLLSLGKTDVFTLEHTLPKLQRRLIALKLSRRLTHSIVNKMRALSIVSAYGWTDAGIRKALYRCGAEHTGQSLSIAMTVKRVCGRALHWSGPPDGIEQRVSEIRTNTDDGKTLKPCLDGNDICDILGISSGPEVGQILDDLMEVIFRDPSKNTREAIVQWLRKRGRIDVEKRYPNC